MLLLHQLLLPVRWIVQDGHGIGGGATTRSIDRSDFRQVRSFTFCDNGRVLSTIRRDCPCARTKQCWRLTTLGVWWKDQLHDK